MPQTKEKKQRQPFAKPVPPSSEASSEEIRKYNAELSRYMKKVYQHEYYLKHHMSMANTATEPSTEQEATIVELRAIIQNQKEIINRLNSLLP